MVPDATHLDLKVSKPRRWYRRRGWQVLLLLLAIFIGWFTWAIIEVNETTAYLAKLRDDPHCEVRSNAPEWIENTKEYVWFPKLLSNWLIQRFQYPTMIKLSAGAEAPSAEALIEGFSNRSWPYLERLDYDHLKVWDGKRLLIPMRCAGIKSLTLIQTGVDDVALGRFLPAFPKLESLSIYDSPVQGVGLSHLKKLSELKYLHLSGCQLSRLDFLEYAPQLFILNLSRTTITDDLLTSFKYCNQLSSLYFNNTQLTGTTLTQLQACQELIRLGIANTQITDATIRELPFFPLLQIVNLGGTAITGIGLFEKGVPEHLHWVNLSGTQVRWKNLEHLKGCKSFEEMFFRNTPVDDDGIEILCSFPGVYKLDMDGTAISDSGIRSIASMPRVVVLCLRNTKITSSSGVIFKQINRLCRLYLDNTVIDNDCIAALRGHPSLCEISFAGTKVNDQVLPHLLALPRLVCVIVNKCQFSESVIKQLRDRRIKVELFEESRIYDPTND